jgi:heme a synthase
MEKTLTKAEVAIPAVRTWLYWVAFFVFLMVIVGGATRLTDSGLSITEWQPLLGAIPPLNEADWLAAFAKYKLIPEFKTQNQNMDLAGFKFIYWWEWAHRFLGRFIGVVFAILYFALTGRLQARQWPRMIFLLLLGGAQGALGWYMVKSGLVDRVDVSQYRLAAHLTLATAIFAAILWVAFGLDAKRRWPRSLDGYTALLLLLLVFLQIASGGFVAGLDAGMGYTTWPKMDGQWLPNGLLIMQPAWRNLFENAMTVQFDHRILAYVILIITALHTWRTFSLSAVMLLYGVITQACLGILTLLLHVPLAVALVHQGGALFVLILAVRNLHKKTLAQEKSAETALVPALAT